MDLQKEIQEEIKEDDLDSNLVFSESFTKNIRAKLLNKRLIKKFKQDTLIVDKYDFDDDKSRMELFSYVKELKSKQIVADRIPTILNEICHISFSKLLIIYLGLMDHMQGPICSIEALAYLDAENLQLLHIAPQKLTHIKVLGKTRWRNLDVLSIEESYINQADLSRVMFKKEARGICVTGETKMLSIAKLQPESLGQYLQDAHKMIRQDFLMNTIGKKYPGIYIGIQ